MKGKKPDIGAYQSEAQLRAHYEIEKALAQKLRNAPRKERGRLYATLYDELFKRVPFNPFLGTNLPPQFQAAVIRHQMQLVKPFLNPKSVFLELGPGDCKFASEVARFVQRVYAVEVSRQIIGSLNPPQNLLPILSDGCRIALKENSIDTAYSNQLMEHLHPEDAVEQLREIRRVLKTGGHYLCITPNRLAGPHDVSQYFDTIASGFHLKEYSVAELRILFKAAGFRKLRVVAGGKGYFLRLPPFSVALVERILERFPYQMRKRLARSTLFRSVLGIRLIGQK